VGPHSLVDINPHEADVSPGRRDLAAETVSLLSSANLSSPGIAPVKCSDVDKATCKNRFFVTDALIYNQCILCKLAPSEDSEDSEDRCVDGETMNCAMALGFTMRQYVKDQLVQANLEPLTHEQLQQSIEKMLEPLNIQKLLDENTRGIVNEAFDEAFNKALAGRLESGVGKFTSQLDSRMDEMRVILKNAREMTRQMRDMTTSASKDIKEAIGQQTQQQEKHIDEVAKNLTDKLASLENKKKSLFR